MLAISFQLPVLHLGQVSCPMFPLEDLSKHHLCIETCEFSYLLHHVYMLELKVSIILILADIFSSNSE
jgi:hypothetical protein